MSISVNGVQEANSKLSYITTAAFNGSIYQYTTALNTTNFNTEGQLALITTLPSGAAVSSTNCPAGRILREVGKKLYPGANPGLVLGDKYQGTTVANNNLNHVWVSVFDSVTGLRGFIDPNASLFAIYNVDRNRAFVDVAETAGGTPTRLGPSIYTGGSVTAVGNVTSSGTVTGDTVSSSGNVVVGGQLRLTTATKTIPYVVTTSPYNFATNLGPFYSFAAAAAVAITATGVPPTGTVLTVFYSGAFTTTPGSGFVGATVVPTGTQCIAVSYVSNGTVLIEYARSGALPTVPTFP
jgi:hypothetical protein